MRFSFIHMAMAVVLALSVMGQAPKPAGSGANDVLRATLKNGLRVVIVRNAIGSAVSTEMTYLVGSRDDPAEVPGMAHAQEHMMFRGTRNLSTSELGTVATALGGGFNASTNNLVTQFQFTVPAPDLDAVLRIEADRMRDVLDAQSQWENERGAIEQEVLRNESSPGSDFFRAINAIAFASSPYAHDGVGTRAAFDKLTGPQIKAFYERWYAPNNAVLVVAGDVEPERTLAAIREHFEAIPAHAVPQHSAAQLKPIRRTVLERPTTLPYPLAVVAVRMPGLASPDFLPSFVLQGILGSERGPLRALVDSGEALGGDWVSQPYLPEAQLAFAAAPLPQTADPRRMASRLESILSEYAAHGVPRELFDSTKRRLIASQEISRNSVSALASDWATTIAVDGEPSIAHEEELIAKVTFEEVNSVAKRYLDMNHAIVGALTPSALASASGQPASSGGPEKPLEPQPPVTHLPDWAKTLLAHIEQPQAPPAPYQAKLANGITLIVQPETISDSVFLYGTVKAPPVLTEPAGKEGVASVLATMLEYGTQQHDRATFQRALDDADAELVAGFDFRLQTTTEQFGHAAALLAENELQPRFDEATFEAARRRAGDELATALNSSNTIAQRRAALYLLPPGDPELRDPTARALQSLTLDDVKAYFAKTMRPDLATIVIAGNITPATARAVIEREFANWRAPATAPASLDLPPVPLNGPGEVKLTFPSGQDIVRFDQIVPLARSAQAIYPLLLGDAILGGGSLGPEQSRLFRDLRQNSGLVYSISSQLLPRRSRYQFTIEFACLPANQARIISLINSEIERMKTEPVGDFELSLAKASLIRGNAIAGASVGAIAESLLGEAIGGMPFNQDQLDAAALLATDARAVQEAMAQHIHPERFVQTIEGP